MLNDETAEVVEIFSVRLNQSGCRRVIFRQLILYQTDQAALGLGRRVGPWRWLPWKQFAVQGHGDREELLSSMLETLAWPLPLVLLA